MSRAQESLRAVPLLQAAAHGLTQPAAKTSAEFALFECYLDLKDWKSAEAIWPAAVKQLTPAEVAPWVERIALSAAKAGAKSDAMRLWRRKDTIDKTNLAYLEQVAKAGLKSELTKYYAQLAKANPDATYIRDAQKILLSLN